jgi:hypothetical protein
VAAVSIPEPGYDEIVLTTPPGPQPCNSRGCAVHGGLADVIVAYGILTDPGFRMNDRGALWPECWGRRIPMCGGCWDATRPVAVEYRPGLMIRDLRPVVLLPDRGRP